MMKKINVIGLALFAMLALSAFAASSAFAVKPVWLFEKLPISVALAVDAEGELALADLKVPIIGTVEVLCSGFFDGTVGPGAVDLIESVLDLTGLITIEELGGEGLPCTNVTGCPTPLLHPDELPWDTELMELEVGVEDFDNLILNAGFSVECMSLGLSDLCLVLEGLQYLSNGAGGIVEALIWLEENVGECQEGGLNSADVMLDGVGLILHVSGGNLEISEE